MAQNNRKHNDFLKNAKPQRIGSLYFPAKCKCSYLQTEIELAEVDIKVLLKKGWEIEPFERELRNLLEAKHEHVKSVRNAVKDLENQLPALLKHLKGKDRQGSHSQLRKALIALANLIATPGELGEPFESLEQMARTNEIVFGKNKELMMELSVPQASKLIPLSLRHTWREIAEGHLKFVKRGRLTRIRVKDLEEYKNRSRSELRPTKPLIRPLPGTKTKRRKL